MTLRMGYHKKDRGNPLLSLVDTGRSDKDKGKAEERRLMDTGKICELMIALLYIIKIIFH